MNHALRRRDADVAAFLRALEETPDLWRSLDIRVIAIRLDGEWHNLVTRCLLDARVPAEVPRVEVLPETEHLGCWQDVQPVSHLPALLEELCSGEIRVGEVVVRACALSESPGTARAVGEPYSDADAVLPGQQHTASPVVQPRQYLAHLLFLRPGISGRGLTNFISGTGRALDQELLALDRPFDGLEGLARVALRTTTDITRGASPQVEIVAPLGASLDKPNLKLRRGELIGAVWAASPATAARCTVGYVAEIEDGGFQNGTVHLQSHWDPERAEHATFSLQFGSHTRRVTLLLRIGPHLVDRHVLEDTPPTPDNPHLILYQAMDPGLEFLREALRLTEAQARKHKDAARRFERAVAQLFSLAGLHVDSLGGFGGTQEAVDALAMTSDGRVVMAIECTLGALASPTGKPQRLMARVHDLQRVVGRRGVEVLPVMVTSRARSAVPKGDIEFVAHDGVVVLCREELDTLTEHIERGAAASDLIVFCRQHVARPASTRQQAHSFLRGRVR